MTTALLDVPLVSAAVRVLGVALLAAAVTLPVAFVYRSRMKSDLPDGATLVIGLGVAAMYLNTRLALVQFVGDEARPLALGNAVVNLVTFAAAGLASFGGRHLGHDTAESGRVSLHRFQPSLGPVVRATGRFIRVRLPEQIEDIEGYDVVPEATKEALAGEKLDFPRGLTVEELRTQLAARLKERHQVGYVDVDLEADGTVNHLAVGQRAIGLGPTLPPGTAAVAVHADPPFSASPGDTVHLWRPGGEEREPERVGRGELRASVGSVATLVTDQQTAQAVDAGAEYRLVTLSAPSQADREFASMLRRGDETLSVLELSEESPMIGSSIAALDFTIIAVESADETVETLPTAARALRAGDRVHAIARPERLRVLANTPGTRVHDPLAQDNGALGDEVA